MNAMNMHCVCRTRDRGRERERESEVDSLHFETQRGEGGGLPDGALGG